MDTALEISGNSDVLFIAACIWSPKHSDPKITSFSMGQESKHGLAASSNSGSRGCDQVVTWGLSHPRVKLEH